eukprot:gene8160-1414_t
MLNGGKPVAQSIPATEHSVMTAWATEQEAMENMIEQFGTGLFAVVMDSYDYHKALFDMLPVVAAKKLGYKVIKGCGVIQGDGIDIEIIRQVMGAVQAAGFSAENVAYGMGGGLLQKVHRDTMSFATKLNHIVHQDGREVDIMKQPMSDSGKFSLPGVLAVKSVNGVPTVFPADSGEVSAEENMLKLVYDMGPVKDYVWGDFETVRQRVKDQWTALPLTADVISPTLRKKVSEQLRKRGKAMPRLGSAAKLSYVMHKECPEHLVYDIGCVKDSLPSYGTLYYALGTGNLRGEMGLLSPCLSAYIKAGEIKGLLSPKTPVTANLTQP